MNNYQIKQYINKENTIRLNVIFQKETAWLSIEQLSLLFNKSKSAISRQLIKIIKDNNLEKESVVAKFESTLDDKTYKVPYYNLDTVFLLSNKLPNPSFNEFKLWVENTIKSYYMNLPVSTEKDDINGKIHIIRGQQVMLDFDLAKIYGYSTSSFNRQVSNNIDRFDEDFRFQLTKDEFDNLICKNYTSSWGGIRKLPYAFTEQGIYMLAGVLRGTQAIEQHKLIIRTFKGLREYFKNELNFTTNQFIAFGLSNNSTLSNTFNLSQIPEIEKEYQLLLSTKDRIISAQTKMLAYTLNIEAKEIKRVLDLYSDALVMLDNYDHGTIEKPKGTKDIYEITYKECRNIIDSINYSNTSHLFGLERQIGVFEGIILNIYQTVFGEDIYPSMEEKAANLLYFIVKDHPFVDGCKRIAATIFLYFLNKNNKLIIDGKLIISSDSLAIITLLIAESNPKEKETMIKVVMSLLV